MNNEKSAPLGAQRLVLPAPQRLRHRHMARISRLAGDLWYPHWPLSAVLMVLAGHALSRSFPTIRWGELAGHLGMVMAFLQSLLAIDLLVSAVGMLFRMRVAWIAALLSAAGSLAGRMRNLCPHLRGKPREPTLRELRRVLAAFEGEIADAIGDYIDDLLAVIQVAHQHVIEGMAFTALRLQLRQDSGSREAQRLCSSDANRCFSVGEMVRVARRGVLGQKLLKSLPLVRLQFGVIGAEGEPGNFGYIKIRADDGAPVGHALLPGPGRRLVQAVE